MATDTVWPSSGLSARHIALLLITFVALLIAIGLFFDNGQRHSQSQQWANQLDQLRGDAAELARTAFNLTATQTQTPVSPRIATSLSTLVIQVEHRLHRLEAGNPSEGIPSIPAAGKPYLQKVVRAWSQTKPYIATIVGQSSQSAPNLGLVADASRHIGTISLNKMEPDISELRSAISTVSKLDEAFEYGAYGAGAVALIALILFVITFINYQVAARLQAEEKDAEQQQAILNLLDEITDLAGGDLTVDVTVSEDFTGAIADSINYTIQTLRTLVGTISQTSEQVAAAAAHTTDVARGMSADSDRQAQKINVVTEEIVNSSHQLQEVSGRADRLSAQAQDSVGVANNGALTVGRTIQNMTALRDQIQDTAKRIKRLGESSQEIGNIIELIDDIAEQTNTLALNASIQAAMAGESGRGFAVVAEQVQSLAERASSATRQIENLVKTIQADSQEAITSMERSTSNVVAGAQSAEDAGQSLTRVEASSQELARAITEISEVTRAQSQRATHITEDMQSIRQIAVQTSNLAGQTANAVNELNTLADRLRESIADFTLPGPVSDPSLADT